MTALPRRVIVDDTDPQIQYLSKWLASDGSEDPNPNGTSGHPFQNTTHVAPWNISASLSFQFQGSSPQLFGVANSLRTQSRWACFIDGVNISPTPGSLTEGLEHTLLCDGTRFVEGSEYTLTLNSTGSEGGPVVWIDYITYIPASAPPDSATVLVDRLDPAIVYSPEDWTIADASSNLARFTQTNGSRLAFNFTGTSVSWVGYTPQTPSNKSTNATYSIDGGEPELFGLYASPFANQSNQVFFTSPNLNPGPHSLTVIYGGDNTTTPLTLDHLVITNASTASLSPVVSLSAASSLPSAKSLTSAGSSTSPTGAIVGSVIGGVVVLCVAALVLWWYNRQRRTGNSENFNARRGDDATTSSHLAPSNTIFSSPTMAEASNRTPGVYHAPTAGPPKLDPFASFDDPSGIDSPVATPQRIVERSTSHPAHAESA